MLTTGVREHAGRILVHDLHVGNERDACVQPLEQIVRQERVLRHAVLEGSHEGVDVIQTLAREDAFTEQVLIRVGHRRGVGVDTRVA